jgi:hypothetical protein
MVAIWAGIAAGFIIASSAKATEPMPIRAAAKAVHAKVIFIGGIPS